MRGKLNNITGNTAAHDSRSHNFYHFFRPVYTSKNFCCDFLLLVDVIKRISSECWDEGIHILRTCITHLLIHFCGDFLLLVDVIKRISYECWDEGIHVLRTCITHLLIHFCCDFLLLVDVIKRISSECWDEGIHILRTCITHLLVHIHLKKKIAPQIAAHIASVNGHLDAFQNSGRNTFWFCTNCRDRSYKKIHLVQKLTNQNRDFERRGRYVSN